jgi:DNA mismatch endonuclease (patch repair protein)
MMAAVQGRENAAEITLRKALWRLGYRYRVQARDLVGRPDIVLPKYRTVIFVDGDFWHGRALVEGGEAQLRQVIRGQRFDWWRAKLARNIARDVAVTDELRATGWRVVRVWESELKTDFASTVSRVTRAIARRRASRSREHRSTR